MASEHGSASSDATSRPQLSLQWMQAPPAGSFTLQQRQDMCQQALMHLEANWAVYMARETSI